VSGRAAQHVADSLRTHERPADSAFDRFLPGDLREVSLQYWTPLRVVKRAAEWLNDVNARQVVDVGSGAGKFCIAAALLSTAKFTGVEQSASLVTTARGLARTFGVNGRVTFVHSAFGAVMPPVADAYYFYNPFGSYWFQSSRDDEAELACSTTRRLDEVVVAERFIGSVPQGTYVLTYHGFGGRMPDCYELRRVDATLAGGLRLWQKARP
jgi:SAM-dependent methyltransferase